MRLWVWPEIQLFRSQKGHLPVVFFREKTSISVEAMKFGALGGPFAVNWFKPPTSWEVNGYNTNFIVVLYGLYDGINDHLVGGLNPSEK